MLPECIPQTGQVLPNYPDRRLRRIRIIRRAENHCRHAMCYNLCVVINKASDSLVFKEVPNDVEYI